MVKSFLAIFLMVLLSYNNQLEEIYIGKSFSWKVYYDPTKSQPIVEISGIKYGYLDHLQRENETLAKSEIGELYIRGDDMYYKNAALKINVKLKKKSYSSEIDNQRLKVFEINAFNEISSLKDSLKVGDYKFDWQVKEDYIFYRDTDTIPDNYEPSYKKKFYSNLKPD